MCSSDLYGYMHAVFVLTRHHATIFLRYDGRITFLQKYDAMVSHPFNTHFPIICLIVSSTSSEINQDSAVFTRANQHIVYLITPVHTLSVFNA